MKYRIIIAFTFITFFSAQTSVFAQNQIESVDYEIGAMFASNMFVKISGSISVVDSTMKFTIGDKSSKYSIVKYSEPFNKYLITDGIEEYVLTITEQKGKMKGYEHTYLGIFEIKSKFYSVSYALNKKQ